MKTRSEVSASKLRGGFYSPAPLVDVCLDRLFDLIGGQSRISILEPSAGDGGFVRGLGRHPVGPLVASVTAVELLPEEAAKTQAALDHSSLDGRVINGSALDPAAVPQHHDAAVGNPPFVRFQFVSDDDRRHAEGLAYRMGIAFKGVSNLWIPVFLSALNNLRDGGVFSFIVPAECFTGLSGRVVRDWLTQHAIQLRVDLFPPNSFPDVLQEVVILSGQISRESTHGAKIHVYDHGLRDSWYHVLTADSTTWTGLLLRPEHLTAFNEVRAIEGVRELRGVAKLSVATVTGANNYFCIDDLTRAGYNLEQWTRPLMDRVRRAPGIDYTASDHERSQAAGNPAWLIDSSLSDKVTAGAREYIIKGEQEELHTRYKTSIRTPWWKVPVVKPGTLLLSKRSNHYPRLILNSAAVVTTDTVYQGAPLTEFKGRERDIVGSFHNSLTLFTAELLAGVSAAGFWNWSRLRLRNYYCLLLP